MRLPWICNNCAHEWEASPLWTFEECPQCDSEFIGHGNLIEEE